MESISFNYDYSDESGGKTIIVGRKEVQMEVMTEAFVDFFSSVFSVNYNFAAQRIISAIHSEAAGGYDPSIELKRAVWDVYTVGRQVAEGEAHMEELNEALDEMGELIPAERP
jgi:K+-transporting ATPase c subunit